MFESWEIKGMSAAILCGAVFHVCDIMNKAGMFGTNV